jgi:phosphoribosylaminoimidazolecarboxamide formyltransferase / IMP cyclohydrolase
MNRRALLSVWDKTGLIEFARGLHDHGFELVASGGTSTTLADARIAHLRVEDVTASPEMLHGRVKTLHPKIHGGILANRAVAEDRDDLRTNGIAPIHLVVCNLYPFTSKPSIEMIDVGGPTMVRAAAKNHDHVAVVVDPAEYGDVLAELSAAPSNRDVWAPVLSDATRRRLARAAFAHTAAYDAAIVTWFDATEPDPHPLPPTLHLALERADVLRYGENPHQVGARYRPIGHDGFLDSLDQLGGKEMSYLNVFDTEAAWRLAHDVASVADDAPTVAIIKHANACGVATGADIGSAYRRAHACDPVSAFGGVVASTRVVDLEMAEALAPVFTEVLIAPGFDTDALAVLSERKNLRLLRAQSPRPDALSLRSVAGGFLVQSTDMAGADAALRSDWKVPTKRTPDESTWDDLLIAWIICAHISSNAIVIANDGQAVGIGAGQQSRVDAARIAVSKAGDRALGGVCASDAFFPFRDGLDVVADAGVRAVIQPGGSVRDDEVINAADERSIAMVLTGRRHFRH